MINGLNILFIYVTVSFVVSCAGAVEIVGGPAGEKPPPDYTAVEPEGVRHTVDDFAGATWLDTADVNGDGCLDIVASGWTAAEVAWWENDGTGDGWEKHHLVTGFEGAISTAAADVDNDGRTDIIGAAKVAGTAAWWRNATGDDIDWTRYDVATDVPGLFSVSGADLNCDGFTDILAQSTDDPARAVIWWANNDGSGNEWIEHIVENDLPGCRFTTGTDLDRDGDTDILAVAFHQETREVLWYENDGSGDVWTKHVIVDSPEFKCFHAAPADVDGDNDLDVVATNLRKGSYIVWFENDGAGGGWEAHLIDSEFVSPYVVSSVDLDGDGDADVIGTSNSWNTVAWWENGDGTGNAWERHIIDVSFEKARNPVAGDYNGDGEPEIGCAAFGGVVAWWDIIK